MDGAAELVGDIRALAARTARPETILGIGGFAALSRVPVDRYRRPVLVSSTDGVGTKIKLAQAWGRHRGVGVDLVAMVVNDLLPCGAEPFLFLDYLAMGRLDAAVIRELVDGISDGCAKAGCALVGGETAEMPGVYGDGEYDVAGFGVGLVEENEIVDGSRVCRGAALVGLASSGLHSNGFSLVRRLLPPEELDGGTILAPLTVPLADELLAPTRIYAQLIALVRSQFDIWAMAHITGGGLLENVPRTLPEGLGVALDRRAWSLPPIFRLLQERGDISDREMLRTFNCGIGYTLVVEANAADRLLATVRDVSDCAAFRIGEIVEVPPGGERVGFA